MEFQVLSKCLWSRVTGFIMRTSPAMTMILSSFLSNWQMHGYRHSKLHERYISIPRDPPYVPMKTPQVFISGIFMYKARNEKDVLTFEGVNSCFYLWLMELRLATARLAIWLQNFCSHPYLKTRSKPHSCYGIEMVCDGSYLEDQDMWRTQEFSETYTFYTRDKFSYQDFFIKTSSDENYSKCYRSIEIDFCFKAPWIIQNSELSSLVQS